MTTSALPRDLNFLGFRLTPATIEEIVAHATDRWNDRLKSTIFFQNLHTMHLQMTDPEFAASFDDSVAIIDGLPIISLLKIAGHDVDRSQRVTAVDLIGPVLSAAQAQRRRVYVIGQQEVILRTALSEIRASYPRLAIDGHHGYFDIETPEADLIIEQANRFGADLVLVGMGSPRGETWITAVRDRLDTPVIWACGALMEYVAGDVPTPPRWSGPMGLEWCFRLAHDPRRFVGRYVVEPPILGLLLLRRKIFGK